jgi:hypothetical protein
MVDGNQVSSRSSAVGRFSLPTLVRVHLDWQLSVVLTVCARTEVEGLETGEGGLNGGLWDGAAGGKGPFRASVGGQAVGTSRISAGNLS